MSKSVENASASELTSLTFTQAFEQAVQTGRLIRRSRWFGSSTLKADKVPVGEHRLIRFPEQRNWSGEFGPTIEDLRAADWEVV